MADLAVCLIYDKIIRTCNAMGIMDGATVRMCDMIIKICDEMTGIYNTMANMFWCDGYDGQ